MARRTQRHAVRFSGGRACEGTLSAAACAIPGGSCVGVRIPSATLAAARLCLERLAACAVEITGGFQDVKPTSDAATAGREPSTRQCRAVLAMNVRVSWRLSAGVRRNPDACANWRSSTSRQSRLPSSSGGSSRREPARKGEDCGDRAASRCNADELARMEYDFLFDEARHLLAIGYNVTRAPARRELLRSAGVGSALCSFRRDRAGTAAAGELVRPGPPAHRRRRRADAAFLERLDVRVPDAAAGDADLRKHAARPDLPGGGGAADRVREAARRAVGHFGIRLQRGRRRISTISTARSACPASGSSAGSATIWWSRRMPPRSR